MSAVLRVEQLSGGYSPKRSIIHDLDIEINEGEMVGLIGVNGAGKSTTIKHILGLMTPHQGRITINGTTLDEHVEDYRSSYTYVPETPILFDELTVEEHLRLTAMAYGVPEQQYVELTEKLLERFHMVKKRKALSAHLSKGMKQKVMIMSALLAKPSLFIIDEPFLGLDPLGIRSLLEDLVEVKRNGSAILMSSHILSTVEHYCDRFIMLDQGRIIAHGTLDNMLQQASEHSKRAVSTLEEAFYAMLNGGEA
ncbi:ABC transporter ATP-binding protein [Paenibacillus septentrionalis]|uniref:ABC transporter ATP-binding protein n=1 Tax=Paenibacillus septentrionalis TaxID=429342 RepID=A0ABW1UYX9_9BACL